MFTAMKNFDIFAYLLFNYVYFCRHKVFLDWLPENNSKPCSFQSFEKKPQMISWKYLIFLTLIMHICYNDNKTESQKGIDFIYQQKLLLAEKFVNIQFLVPFPGLNVSLENQFRNLSLLLKNSWNDYSFGCQLDHITNETSLNFDYLHHTENEFKSVQLDILNMKSEFRGKFGTEEQTTKQTDNERTKRGAGLISLGALTAVTAGAGKACSLGSIFGACGGYSRDREAIDLASSQIELNNHLWAKIKGKVN